MNLPEFSVRHSIFGNMLTIFVLLAGLWMVATMQRDTFPEIEIDIALVTTIYPGASAEEIENLITNPIEDELRDVENIEKITSSSVEGISVISLEVNPDAKNKERIFRDIERKVDQVRNLPEEAEEPDVQVVDASDPIMRICIAGDVSEDVLRSYGDTLRNRIMRIPGVGTVVKNGWRDQEFWVEVDLEKIEELELPLTQVSAALARRNVNRPGGKVIRDGEESVVRTIGQFWTAEEIEGVVVRSNTDGDRVFVKDIATVTRTYEEDTVFATVNGHRAVLLEVKKKRTGDTIDIADALKQLLVEEQAVAPDDVYLTYVDDTSFYVKRRLTVLGSNGIVGLVLVIAILFMFLNARVALITGIGIPFAFLAALLIMSFFGVTINLITMFGLILVLGMVVDDAIIVGENVFRHMEEGMLPRDAAIKGTTEVMFPVVSTVLTTVAAFLPLVFAPDTYGQVLRWFPVVVAITLGASLFEVLIILPCHAADFVKPIPHEKTRQGTGRPAHPVMHRIEAGFEKLIHASLSNRYKFFMVMTVFFGVLGFGSVSLSRMDMFPSDMIDQFIVRIWAEEGTTLEETQEIASRLEGVITELPTNELQDVVFYYGGQYSMQMGFQERGTHMASGMIYLTPQNTRERKTLDLIDDLRSRTADLPGIQDIEYELLEFGPPAGRPLEVRVRGRDFAVLEKIGADIRAYLESVEGVYDIRADLEEGKNEIQVRVNEEEAARLGLSLEGISFYVMTAFQGAESTVIREGNDEVIVRVRLAEQFRNDPATLQRLSVPNHQGRMVPLERVAEFRTEPGKPVINHYEGERVVTVSASLNTDVIKSTEINRMIAKKYGDIPAVYPGYDLIQGGEWEETQKLTNFLFTALIMAVLLIYTILVVQFNSFFQPFVVLVSIPLGIIGVVMALVLHGKPISMMAMMGMIGLAGVVVNDAIVLVKFINDARRNRNMPIYDAVAEATMKRLRPILLTSITTIAGLVPVIYGIGGYEPFVAPAAISLAYGLLFATVLTLLVVPVTYYLAFDAKRVVMKLFGRLFRFLVPGSGANS